MDKLIQEQAEFVFDFSLSDDAVLERAKWILLDSIGCMINGLQNGKVTGEYEEQVIELTMAMVNTELYEGNKFAIGHPAAHLLPLLLVEGCQRRVSAEKFFEAFITSYEVAGRWGASFALPLYSLGHGMTMTAATAAAFGKLDDSSMELICEAMKIAASLPNVSVWNAVYSGSELHDAYAGLSALNGRRAVSLAKKGVRSTKEIIEEVYGKSLQAAYRPDKMTEGLGKDYWMMKNYFKVHTGCRFIHPFADVIQKKIENGLRAEDIKSIEIFTYKKAARINQQSVPNELAGKFSIPVSIEVLLVKKVLDADSIRNCQEDEQIMELAKRIFVHEDETYNALLPEIRGGKVVIHRLDGGREEEEVFHAAGDYDNPDEFTKERLVKKFTKITAPYMKKNEQEHLVQKIFHMKNLQDISVNDMLQDFYQLIY